MATTCEFHIIGEYFPSKASLKRRILEILYRYADGGRLDEGDFKFMLDVLKMHPDAVQKIGAGVEGMIVRTNPVFRNTQGFWIERVDGTSTDFSFLSCLNGESSPLKKFSNACRTAIYPFIREKKKEFFRERAMAVCPYTGITISMESCHADHRHPMTFQHIMGSFIRERGIVVENARLKGDMVDGAISDVFDDIRLEMDWVNYHNAQADIQIVSMEANIGILRRNHEAGENS